MDISDLLTNLHVLGMLKENDKLCRQDGHIAIEPPHNPLFSSLKRWYYNDSRRIMIMDINNIIHEALASCSKAKESNNIWLLKQFFSSFSNVKLGLSNLQKTYFQDSTIVARLNVISLILDEEINKLSSFNLESND